MFVQKGDRGLQVYDLSNLDGISMIHEFEMSNDNIGQVFLSKNSVS